jgi:hypothetical protein
MASVYLNPSAFAKKYRAALIADLELNERLACPYCVINYPDGDYAGNCYYERDSTTKKIILNCAYEYEKTPQEKVNTYWVEGVLKDCLRTGGDALKAKWEAIFKADGVVLLDN